VNVASGRLRAVTGCVEITVSLGVTEAMVDNESSRVLCRGLEHLVGLRAVGWRSLRFSRQTGSMGLMYSKKNSALHCNKF
jgi:hypothetical protein